MKYWSTFGFLTVLLASACGDDDRPADAGPADAGLAEAGSDLDAAASDAASDVTLADARDSGGLAEGECFTNDDCDAAEDEERIHDDSGAFGVPSA